MDKKKLAILISGRGSNMEAIIQATLNVSSPTQTVCVITDNETAQGINIAKTYAVPTHIIPRAKFSSKQEHEQAIEQCLSAYQIDYIALAGYMRLLSSTFIEKREGKIINVHPSLLPSFKGLDTHARALKAGVRIHGCSVHFVTTEMDEGPIIAQGATTVLLSDTVETLAERVLKIEHKLYPICLNWLAQGKVCMHNKQAVFHDFSTDTSIEHFIIYPKENRPPCIHTTNEYNKI